MCEDRYQYVLELFKRESGALLGRVPIQPDWVPVEEALTFDLVRRGLLANFNHPPLIQIEPEWTRRAEDDAPIIRVLATAKLGGDHSESLVVPIDYFAALARRAADQFVEAGQLQAGELFEYAVLACQRPLTTTAPPARFVLERVAPPVPITPACLPDLLDRALLFGTMSTEVVPAFVHWSVLEEASVLTRQAGALETGGILIGYVHRDPASPEVFLEITAQVPAEARSQLTRLSFSPETWSKVQSAVNARGRKEIWLGWWHSHSYFKQETEKKEDEPAKRPSAFPFLSAEDHLLHRTVFPRAFSLALLITDSPDTGMSWTMFGWKSGTIIQRAFHVIHAPLPEAFTALRGENHAAA